MMWEILYQTLRVKLGNQVSLTPFPIYKISFPINVALLWFAVRCKVSLNVITESFHKINPGKLINCPNQ